jgi:hypothetical protein
MSRYAGEPDLGPWSPQSPADVAGALLGLVRTGRDGSARTGPLVVAVDGRSAGGKSTVAGRVVEAIGDATVVHTDDVAWYHGFFGWDGLLVDGVLEPLARGEAVSFRPPAWVQRDRPGAIEVPAGVGVVVVEGVGASRRSLATWLDGAVWVQSDADEAQRRGIERDITLGRGREEAVSFWDEWMAEEVPFLAADRPWERADLVVCGTPTEPVDGLLVSRARATRGGPAPRTS